MSSEGPQTVTTRTTPAGYTRTQIRLHWIVALLIVPQFVFHDAISEAWEAAQRGVETAGINPLVPAHVFGGLAILALVIWRLVLRARLGAPPPPEAEHPALKLVAKVTHGALYLLLILLPVSGGVAWFGGVAAAADNHELFKTALLALVVLHVLGALFHQVVLKSDVLTRMKRPV